MTVRAFVAVDVPELEGVLRVREELARLDADLKLVAPENVHITLAFLGDVDEALVPSLRGILEEAARDVAPFTMHLQGVGHFGGRSPRVVWLGVHEGREPLKTLADGMRGGLRGLPVKQDRKPFRAHVTLARSRSPRGGDRVRDYVDAHRDVELGTVDVTAVHLMKSTLTPRGPVYEALETVNLED